MKGGDRSKNRREKNKKEKLDRQSGSGPFRRTSPLRKLHPGIGEKGLRRGNFDRPEGGTGLGVNGHQYKNINKQRNIKEFHKTKHKISAKGKHGLVFQARKRGEDSRIGR